MKEKHKIAHMKAAFDYAECSEAVRLQVGAVIVKGNQPISIGYNGTPPGDDNCCENIEWCTGGGWTDPDDILAGWPYEGTYKDAHGNEVKGRYRLVTKDTVIHAERNALDKLTQSTESSNGAVMFITHAPCKPCAISIANVGIKAVYYGIDYRDTVGIDYLRAHGVIVEKVDISKPPL